MADWLLRGVYAITDASVLQGRELVQAVEEAILGGAQIIQYRDKEGDRRTRRRQAEALRYLCQRYELPLIINDDVDLAGFVDAAGVHLGEDDPAIAYARERLGDEALIGVSCYDSLERAREAESAGANYVAFGSVFPSPSKPDAVRVDVATLAAAKRGLAIPVCAIGGIRADNAAPLVTLGVDMLAVISEVFDQPDIEIAAGRLAALFAGE